MEMPRAQQGTPCRETFLPESFIFLLALLILAVMISKRCNERGERSRVFVRQEGGVVRRLVLILGSHAPFCLVQGWFLLSRAVCPRAGRFLALCSPMGWFSVGGGGFDGDNTCMMGCALFYSYAQPIKITKTSFSKSTAALGIPQITPLLPPMHALCSPKPLPSRPAHNWPETTMRRGLHWQ